MSAQIGLLTYVWHYVIARLVYDMLGIGLVAALIAFLFRAKARRRWRS